MKSLRFYKAQKDSGGAASQWDLNLKDEAVFFTMAKQLNAQDAKGNATFDWEHKSVFKLGIQDIGELLAVLEGKKDGVGPYDNQQKYKGLYHSWKDMNSVLYFTRGREAGFFVGLSVKKHEQQNRVKHSLTDGEGSSLRVFLQKSLELILFTDVPL